MSTFTQFETIPVGVNDGPNSANLVAVAMSGGVDSSVVAALLQQQGRQVVGLTMQLWNQRRLPELLGDGPAQLGGPWCPGSYTARVEVIARPVCAQGMMCPQFIRVVAVLGPAVFRISG